MNTGLYLVKLLIQPHYVILDENGKISGEASPQQALPVYAHEVDKVKELLDKITAEVAANVLAPKS